MGKSKGRVNKRGKSSQVANEGNESIYKLSFKCSLEKLSSSYPKSAQKELTYEALLRDIVPKILDHENLTWREVREMRTSEGKLKNHDIDITKGNSKLLVKSLKNKVEENLLEESDLEYIASVLFSLRINGKKRLFGYINDAIFYVLWYDKSHDIIEVPKKNT